jgi:hypothetical protein
MSPIITSANINAELSAACNGYTVIYRQHLYFYNNTVLLNGTDTMPMFELSLDGTQADAWNNIFAFVGGQSHALLQNVGQLNLRGSNLVFGSSGAAFDSSHQPLSATSGGPYCVSTVGTALSGDPLFTNVATGNVTLTGASPAKSQAMALPAGAQAATGTGGASSAILGGAQLPFSPSANFMHLPVTMQPVVGANGGSNGMVARSTANDLGAVGQ